MKTLVLGDIHGRKWWKDIVNSDSFDTIIFLGDYVSSHDNITGEEQIENLKEILDFKESNWNKVILLRGNHDVQHLNYYWADCSGYFLDVGRWFEDQKHIDRFLKDTQWIFINDKIIFSHAGISKTWLKCTGLTIDEINNLPPSELFGFSPGPDNPFDYYGNSIFQPLTWIRPTSLVKDAIDGYIQVVGHTPAKEIIDLNTRNNKWPHIWLCDTCLEQYLIIDNGEFKIKEVSIVK